jgi:hypothetical protein
MVKRCVLFEVRAEFLNYYLDELRLQMVKYSWMITRFGVVCLSL